ncbi:hypothetical protein F4804DRAFT_315329 [Jackrogersella minutella]|nr:hypothetical protein F4804DRAFT_315329 [Jackrogersella minutella]
MAELMRISRPWLLPSMRSRATSPILFNVHRSFSASPRPHAAKTRPSKRSSLHYKPSETTGHAQHLSNSVTLLLPNTLVTPPLLRFPRQPRKFFHMAWLVIQARFQGLLEMVSMKVTSQPKVFISKPLFKFGRAAAIPTAKALHVRMSEAIAAGDRETLRAICTPELFHTLSAAVDARPRGVRAEWELVRYERRWRYPRVADWRVGYQPMGDGGMRLVKQLVLSIASVQRIARFDDSRGGLKIGGSERVRHLLEHFVIQAVVDRHTFAAEPWKVWGTLDETTYEAYLEDRADTAALQNDIATQKEPMPRGVPGGRR